MDRGRRLRRYFSSEFRCSHLWFVHEDWRPFAYTPWLPYWWRVQWLYPVYRCTLSFYFLVWLVYLINKAHFYGRLEQYFSLLTNWCFILWNLYLVVSAVTVSANQLCCHPCWRQRGKEGGNKSKIVTRKLCCSCGQDRSKLCDKLSWLLFMVSAEVAVAVSLLYWAILSKNQDPSLMTSAGNIHVHLINGIVALLDLWIVGLPIHILHFLYTFLCALCYVAFTGVHHVTTNTTTSRLYQVLDYKTDPGPAAGVVIGFALGLLPLLHVLFISQYLLRHWVTGHLQKRLGIYRKFLLASNETAPRHKAAVIRFNVDEPPREVESDNTDV